MGFSENLCEMMENRNVTSYKMAKDLNVHVSTVTNWRNGNGILVDHLAKVAEYFGCSVDSLIQDRKEVE